MQSIDIAKSIAHVHGIVWAGLQLAENARGATAYNRPVGPTNMARALRMAPDTYRRAKLVPQSVDNLPHGLLRIKAVDFGREVMRRHDWDCRFVPSGEREFFSPAWNHILERAQKAGEVGFIRKHFYSPLGYSIDNVPLLVVDLIARAAGYKCGVAVFAAGSSAYMQQARQFSEPAKTVDVDQHLGCMPMLAEAWAHRPGPMEYDWTYTPRPERDKRDEPERP